MNRRVPEPGISAALARERFRTVRDVSYELTFEIPAGPTTPVVGRARIGLTRVDASDRLILDFAGRLLSATAFDQPLTIETINDHLVIPVGALPGGPVTIDLTFESDNGPLNRQEDFLYTLFVPARAHLVFPCFDQPDIKGTFALTLSVPEGWTAVSNAPETRDRKSNPAKAGSHIPETSSQSSRTSVQFGDTPPLPTYLFAFAAGRLAVESGARGHRRLRMFYREHDRTNVERCKDIILNHHAASLGWLEDYTGVSHPFEKLDVVLVPSFQFNGMEHPGAIYYRSSALLLDDSATEEQELSRAMLIAHEVAHLWFGDLVTMRWFDDVWLKEVCANFLAAKVVAVLFPEVNHDVRFLATHYPPAYSVDRTDGTHPIRQPLANLNDAGSLYGPIIYHKAPILLRELETLLAPERLRDALRRYLRQFAFGNADWNDLVGVLEETTGVDVAVWSRTRIEKAGRPLIDQPVNLARLPYGDVRLSPPTRSRLLETLDRLANPVERAAGWIVLWEELLDRRVAIPAFLAALERGLSSEPVEQILQLQTTYLKELFWRFLPAAAREPAAPRLEGLLRRQINRAPTATLKATCFATLRSIFTTQESIAFLERVWLGSEHITGLVLSETDHGLVALELATRGIGSGVLSAQRRRFIDPDRRARFEFVMDAAADEARRAAFFDALADASNRRHEPWVVEGLTYLSHPLRATSAERYLRPALDLLEEIQRTGDIFFPAHWMAAVLGGHRSESAAAIVRDFLRERPTYPVHLRRIVLQSADNLFRAVALNSA